MDVASETIQRISTTGRLVAAAALSLALCVACSSVSPAERALPNSGVVTVDFLEPLGLGTNALAPQVVCADPAHNRVFAACANSSSVAVVDCATQAVRSVPVGSRMPRRLRDGGMQVNAASGQLFLCGHERLIVVDPREERAVVTPLPADFEALALDERSNRAYLVGRMSGAMVVYEGDTGEMRSVPYSTAAEALPFMAASAPPPIRFPFVDPRRERIYVLDGTTSTLVSIDAVTEQVVASRRIAVGNFPRWHAAGFDPLTGRIFVALENEKRVAVHALAVDVVGSRDVILDLPEGHREPAGVTCDAARGELYIPYDNNELIDLVTFGDSPEVIPIELPSMGVDATAYNGATRTLYAASWMQAALYVIDLEKRKRTLTIPDFPVYPHMNSMAFNRSDGRLYVPSGSTAVNGSFGACLTVFDPSKLSFSELLTGWAPVSLVPRTGARSFFVFSSEREFAEVEPDGSYTIGRLPYPYARQAIPAPGGDEVFVAYGPHSSMWPTPYIGGTRDGIAVLGRSCSPVEGGGLEVRRDLIMPRLAQGLIFDRAGRLWALQNTWGREEPFLICIPPGRESWSILRLPPKVDNECLLRLLAIDARTGLLYAGSTGNLNGETGRIYVVDPDLQEILATVDTGRTPADLCILSAADHGRAVVANFDDDTVTIIEDAGRKVTTTAVGSHPIALAAHDAEGVVYVVNHLGASLTVLGPGGTRTVPLPAGALPNNIIVEPTSGEIFVTAHSAHEARVYRCTPRSKPTDASMIDGLDADEVETIMIHEFAYGEVTFDQANAAFQERAQWGDGLFRLTQMAIDAESETLWITDYLSGQLWIIEI